MHPKGTIPFNSKVQDKMIWVVTKNGSFTVKSAYFSTLEVKLNKRGASTNLVVQNSMCRVPEKVKNFLWMANTYSLPTKVNLKGDK